MTFESLIVATGIGVALTLAFAIFIWIVDSLRP